MLSRLIDFIRGRRYFIITGVLYYTNDKSSTFTFTVSITDKYPSMKLIESSIREFKDNVRGFDVTNIMNVTRSEFHIFKIGFKCANLPDKEYDRGAV